MASNCEPDHFQSQLFGLAVHFNFFARIIQLKSVRSLENSTNWCVLALADRDTVGGWENALSWELSA